MIYWLPEQYSCQKIYKFENDISSLNVDYWDESTYKILQKYKKYSSVICPIDGVKEYIVARKSSKNAKKYNVHLLYWCENGSPI